MMGFSHSARSSTDRSVCRWIRSSRSRALLALSASGLIAGRNELKCVPLLPLIASRARKAYPRKVNEVCSCSPLLCAVQIGHARADLDGHLRGGYERTKGVAQANVETFKARGGVVGARGVAAPSAGVKRRAAAA